MSNNIKMKCVNALRHLTNAKHSSMLYLITSLLLSASILLRWQIPSCVWLRTINIGLFLLSYVGGATAAFSYLLEVLFSNAPLRKGGTCTTLPIGIFVVVSAALIVTSPFAILPDYISLTLPVLFAYVAFLAKYKQDGKHIRGQLQAFIALVLASSLILPHLTVFALQNNVMSTASAVSSPSERIRFIASVARNALTANVFRSGSDVWKYLMVGTGACLEIAVATEALLHKAGFEVRRVSLPGEDHTFVEVNVNNIWMVVDPGYNFLEPITREERAEARIREFGAISYVVAYSGSSIAEVTSSYVRTDTITIKITDGGEPLLNTPIHLVHKFMGRNLRIPTETTSFFTDSNGEVTFHLGALTFNEKAGEHDTCYWVYVNGQYAGYNVTSTGTGTTHLVQIDLEK
jgi:hypothetical protein